MLFWADSAKKIDHSKNITLLSRPQYYDTWTAKQFVVSFVGLWLEEKKIQKRLRALAANKLKALGHHNLNLCYFFLFHVRQNVASMILCVHDVNLHKKGNKILLVIKKWASGFDLAEKCHPIKQLRQRIKVCLILWIFKGNNSFVVQFKMLSVLVLKINRKWASGINLD